MVVPLNVRELPATFEAIVKPAANPFCAPLLVEADVNPQPVALVKLAVPFTGKSPFAAGIPIGPKFIVTLIKLPPARNAPVNGPVSMRETNSLPWSPARHPPVTV